MQFDITTLQLLDKACKSILDWIQPNEQSFFTLQGELGSGKTTFVKHMLNLLDDKIQVSSPTYSIVNEYVSDHQIIYHYDLYRLKNFKEALDIGIEDYFDDGYLHFIEWPELIEEILPKNTYQLYFKSTNFERILRIARYE